MIRIFFPSSFGTTDDEKTFEEVIPSKLIFFFNIIDWKGIPFEAFKFAPFVILSGFM